MVVFGVAAGPVPGIGHHELLIFILQFGVILLLARGLGILANRLGMPSVVGELIAGLILGPTILGAFIPEFRDFLFPPPPAEYLALEGEVRAQVFNQANLLDIVSFTGVTLLLILTGLETDLRLIASKGSQALKISLTGIVIPFGLGIGLGYLPLLMPFIADNPTTGEPGATLPFAMFLGIAMAVSAIPVIAKVFIDLGVLKRDLGQLTLAAAMVDDTFAWILLGIVSGLASSGTIEAGTVLLSLGTVLGFLVVSYTLGRFIVVKATAWVSRTLPGDAPIISLILVFALAFGAFAQSLNVEAVLGAFVVGIIFGQIRRVNHHIVHTLEVITLSVFAPVFFATAGTRVNLLALGDPQVLLIAVIVLTIAIGGKFVGAYLGAKWARLGKWEALSLGAGMNARGAVEIIIATIGLRLGVLSTEMFTIIVMVAIVTSLMAPPLLRVFLPRVPYTDEERERLAREAAEKTSLLGNVHRVLIPTRGGTNSQVAAQLVARMADGAAFDVTVMQVRSASDVRAKVTAGVGGGSGDGGGGTGSAESEARFARVEEHLRLPKQRVRRVVRDLENGGGLADAVLGEAKRGGYDLVVLGATETRDVTDSSSAMFSDWVDQVLQSSPVPVLIVSSRWADDAPEVIDTLPIRRILLPTTGSEVNRNASELAFEIANDDDAIVDVIHVVEPSDTWADAVGDDHARELAEEILAAEAALGLSAGAIVHTSALVTAEPLPRVVVDRARACGADLIVLRSDVKPTTRRAFLGHEIDDILREAPCPVAVITRS